MPDDRFIDGGMSGLRDPPRRRRRIVWSKDDRGGAGKDTATPADVEAHILPLIREKGIRSVQVVVDGNR